MQVTVTMSAEEFAEFMSYQRDRDMFNRDVASLERNLGLFRDRLKSAVAPDPKKPGKYKIVDQEYLDDLWILTGNHI
jgi:hypothetical protein